MYIAGAPDGKGGAWVAWAWDYHRTLQRKVPVDENSIGYDAKAIFVNQLAGDDFAEQTEAAACKGQVDSPGLFLDPKGGIHLIWCREGPKGWELWYRGIGPKARAEPARIPVKGKNPRHPRACFDSKGKLWVAYTDATSPRWQVAAEAIGP